MRSLTVIIHMVSTYGNIVAEGYQRNSKCCANLSAISPQRVISATANVVLTFLQYRLRGVSAQQQIFGLAEISFNEVANDMHNFLQ